MNYTLTLLVPPDFHWSSKTSGPPMKVEKRERERERERERQDILLNKQYMFISREELDSRKM